MKNSVNYEECIGFVFNPKRKTCYLRASMAMVSKRIDTDAISCHVHVDVSTLQDTYDFLVIDSSISREFGTSLAFWEKPLLQPGG